MGEDILIDDDQKAEAFNTYFSAQTNISISNYNIELLRKYRSNHIKTPHTFRFTEITPDKVMRTINSMDASKACGPDNLQQS